MDNKFFLLPEPAKADMLYEAANLLESFALHSLEVASNISGNPDASSSWYIQDADELKSESERAKRLADTVRSYGWKIAYDNASNGIKRRGMDFDSFVKEYLTPGGDVDEEAQLRFYRDYILKQVVIDDEEGVANHIKKMEYSEFLKTPYWRFISEERKNHSHGCACCGSTEKLEVHHPVYDWHGYEHNHFWELTVLCHKCHSKFHKGK